MNQELLSKLYKAGFTFKEGAVRCYPNPVLSELIEACGKFALAFNDSDGKWYARKDNEMSAIHKGAGFHGVGDTAEEAVANLWLALNPSK